MLPQLFHVLSHVLLKPRTYLRSTAVNWCNEIYFLYRVYHLERCALYTEPCISHGHIGLSQRADVLQGITIDTASKWQP